MADVTDVAQLERPFFSVSLAARLLRVPQATLRWWLEGRSGGGYEPVLRANPTGSSDVTWGEFIEAQYLRSYRRDHRVPLQRLRPFIAAMRDEFGVSYPLAHFEPFVAEGRRLVLEIEETLELPLDLRMVVSVPDGQMMLTSPAESFLGHVEFSDTLPRWAERVFPLGKESPVVIDPGEAFGSPTVRGIRTDVLAELLDAGEALDAVAADYSLDPDDVVAARFFESKFAA